MRRTVCIFVVIGLAVTACVAIVAVKTAGAKRTQLAALEQQRLERALAELQGQIRQLQSQKKSVEQQARQLEEAVATLAEKRREDQQVIGDLWALVAAGKRTAKKATAEDGKPVPATADKKAPAQRDERKDRKHDVETIKQMLAAAGGNLDAALHQIVTPDRMAKTLEEHAGQPTYWTAAASLAPDQETALAYLQEAAKLYPDSPAVLSALVSAQVAAGRSSSREAFLPRGRGG